MTHTPAPSSNGPLGCTLPVVNNRGMDEWLHKLVDSGNVSPERIERVRELTCEANKQWKRMLLVQRMIEEVQRDHRRAVPIQDIFDVYGVHFTTETMYILEDGIQQSLRNFCRMLTDVLSTWDTGFSSRYDISVLSRRVSLAVSHAPSCLWGSLDTTDLCQTTVHSRLLRAVDGLWNTHAKPAIEWEQHHLAEGIQRLRVLTHVCDEYLRPNTGGRAVPSKFAAMYVRMNQRVIAALAWLSGNTSFVSGPDKIAIVRRMLDAYKVGEHEARCSMEKHTSLLRQLAEDTVLTLESIYSHDAQWDGWHGVLVWGNDEPPPDGALSSLIVQPPSYSASYWKTSRVHCSVAQLPHEPLYAVRSQPVVRFCAILRQLVKKRFLRLDIVGVDYLRLLSHADHARYHRNVNKIVEDELVPVGHLAGHHFDGAWFLETRIPVVHNSALSSLPDCPLVLTDDEAERSVPSAASETGVTDERERVLTIDKKTPLPPPVPEGVVLDHCLMGVISLLAKSNVSGDHMGPYCNTLHLGTADVEPLVRKALCADPDALTTTCLNQRLAGVFKMFSAALAATGMQASFGTDKSHPRVKKLKVSWPLGEQHRARNLARVSQMAESVASHLHHGSVLPTGVTWNIPERSRRRRRARDAKCASEILLGRQTEASPK